MLLPGQSDNIRAFDTDFAGEGDFYTGHANLQKLNFDPFISGFAFVVWTKIPTWVTAKFPNFASMTERNFKSLEGISDMTLNTASYAHSFNNNNYDINATIEKGNNTFSMQHQEFSGSPIKNIYQYWVSGISDPATGIATYPRISGLEYAASNHTGELMYIVTRPDANNVTKHNIEFAAYYTNVMPKTIPLSHLNFTEGTHDVAQLTIDFTGQLNISPAVDNMAAQLLSKTYSFRTEDDFDPDASVGANFTQDHGNNDPHLDDYSEGERSTTHDKITAH